MPDKNDALGEERNGAPEAAEPRPEETGEDPEVAGEGAQEAPSGAAVEGAPTPDLEARLRMVSAAYQKLLDEMEQYRQRMERLQEERDRRRKGEVVMAMFEPVQNLRRSIEALRKLSVDEDTAKGLELVLAQFQAALATLGLEEISATGVAFDPTLHDALTAMDVPAAEQDGVVLHVFDAGYRIGTQVIRPARVVIGRFSGGAEPEA